MSEETTLSFTQAQDAAALKPTKTKTPPKTEQESGKVSAPRDLKENSAEGIADVKAWAETAPQEAVDTIFKDVSNDVSANVINNTPVKAFYEAEADPVEEPVPDVEIDVDHDEIIDQLVTKPVENKDVVDPKLGQASKHAAVRNVFVPKAAGRASTAPTISSTATGIHKKPASVKSVLGNRSGAFKINQDKPIRN